jgi:anti-sigma factor RsiW
MNCADLEILICDYVDGTLSPAQSAEVERHLAECASCAALASDSAAAVRFMERAADVEPPPELISRILFDPPWQKRKSGWFGKVFHGVLQPRFAMSMALTILSFSMVVRNMNMHQLQPADLQPAKVWANIENRGHLLLARAQKFYDSLKFVYQIQTTLREWQQDQEQQAAPDNRKLPVKTPPQTPEGTSK